MHPRVCLNIRSLRVADVSLGSHYFRNTCESRGELRDRRGVHREVAARGPDTRMAGTGVGSTRLKVDCHLRRRGMRW